MSQDGIPDSLIIEKIRHSDTTFHLDAKDLHALKETGVSDDVVMAMLRTEDSGYAGDYRDGYYWPYDSPWYLGLDFGFYAPYYRAYPPIYVGHGFGTVASDGQATAFAAAEDRARRRHGRETGNLAAGGAARPEPS